MAAQKPRLRLRSYTVNDAKSYSPISITPNDIFASPTVRLKSYYERGTKIRERNERPKTPTAAAPSNRVAMVVHAPDHDPMSKRSMFGDGNFDWSGRGNHVDFGPDEVVQLEQAGLLRRGANRQVAERGDDGAVSSQLESSVHQTTCKGVKFAWKKIQCKRQINAIQHEEIKKIKRLDHRHVMRLVGTYTSKNILGVLLWPVAVCNLGALMDDLDHYLNPDALTDELDLSNIERGARLDAIMGHGMTSSVQRSAILPLLQRRLLRCFGCLASALAYLHKQGIEHKNLKPSNVLLSFDGLWLTGFENSSELPENLCTSPKGDDRNSLKYLPPKMDQINPSGMAGDIFALGAVYLEMIALCDSKRLHVMTDLRPDRDRSFQANLIYRERWLDAISSMTRRSDGHLLELITEMLSYDPERRPNAAKVNARLSVYTPDLNHHQREGNYSLRYYDTCCRHIYLGPKEEFYNNAPWTTRHQASPKAEWLVRKPDKKAFDTLFNKIDTRRTGAISKNQVIASFSIWGLPEEILLEIWRLSAIQDGDDLEQDEFAVAMFLIRSQMGAVKGLPKKLPHKLIPPSLRAQLHLKEDAPRGYLYHCPKSDCPFQLDKGLTGPEQLKQHLAVFHVDIAARRRADSLKKMGRLSPHGPNMEEKRPPLRLEDSRARMENAMKGTGKEEPVRLSLLEQARVRKRGATISEMEALREVWE